MFDALLRAKPMAAPAFARVDARLRCAATLLLCVVLACPTLAHADVIALQELVSHALQKRPTLAVNDARITEARARVDQARSAYAPTIALMGDASLAPGQHLVREMTTMQLVAATKQLGDPGAFDAFARYGATLDVRGNVYDFGRTAAAVDAAHAERRAAEAESQRSAHEVMRDVRLAYVHWATTDALFTLARDAAQAAEDRSHNTSASIEEGARPSADRILAQSDAGFARLELERASANLETARLDLGLVCVTNIPPDAQPDPTLLGNGSVSTAKDTTPAGQRDPALASLEEQRAAAHATARVHDHAFAPVLSAQAQAGIQGYAERLFPLYRVAINLSVPLWDGGLDAAARAAAEAHAAGLAAQAAEYSQQRDETAKRMRAAREQATRRIGVAGELVDLTRTRLAQLEEGYSLGAATLKDLADARAAVQRARTELVLAQAMRAEASLGVQ